MSKTPGEANISRLAQAAFLKPWVFPNLFYEPGKEAADLIVRFGDTLLIASEKTSTFTGGRPGLGWKRWYSRTIEGCARQIRGAERKLRTGSPALFVDAKCTEPAPPHLFESPPREIFRMIFAHGAGLATQRFFRSNTASLCIDADRTGAPPKGPFSVNPFLDPGTVFHVLDDYTAVELFRFIDTAPDLFRYLRKKEELLRSFDAFSCHGEEELLQHYLRNVDDDLDHGFSTLIAKAKAQNANGVLWSEDTYTEFRVSPVILRRLEDDKPSYMVDRFINWSAANAQPAFGANEKFKEEALRELASISRTARRMIGSHMAEICRMEHDHQSYYARVQYGRPDQPLGDYAVIYLSLRSDKIAPDDASLDDIQQFSAMIARAYALFIWRRHPNIKKCISFVFIKDRSGTRPRYSEGLATCRPIDFDAEEIEALENMQREFSIGKNASDEQEFHLREYQHELPEKFEM